LHFNSIVIESYHDDGGKQKAISRSPAVGSIRGPGIGISAIAFDVASIVDLSLQQPGSNKRNTWPQRQ